MLFDVDGLKVVDYRPVLDLIRPQNLRNPIEMGGEQQFFIEDLRVVRREAVVQGKELLVE